MQAEQNPGEAPVVKIFGSYEPGFVRMDIKYLPQMPHETARRYLFVAIDRATRRVHACIYADQGERNGTHFLRNLKKAVR